MSEGFPHLPSPILNLEAGASAEFAGMSDQELLARHALLGAELGRRGVSMTTEVTSPARDEVAERAARRVRAESKQQYHDLVRAREALKKALDIDDLVTSHDLVVYVANVNRMPQEIVEAAYNSLVASRAL